MAKLTDSVKASFCGHEAALRDFWVRLAFLANRDVGDCARTGDSIEPDVAAVLGGFVDEHPKVKASKAVAAQVRLRMLAM